MTWIPDEKASTPTSTEASTPLLAVTASYVHVVWLDKRSGPFQIYYRRRDRPADAAGSDAGVGGTDSDADTNPPDGEPSGCGCASSRGVTAAWPLFALVVLLRGRRRVSTVARCRTTGEGTNT
ncbi:MAG: MYXO-CTERM sorting domain-containing protein [Kofleriaceae bacterium]